MGLEFFLINKRIKDRWIHLNVLWTDHYIHETARLLNVQDPMGNDWDEERNRDGTDILLYKAFLRIIKYKLGSKKNKTKFEIDALDRVTYEIKSINSAIKSKNLNNWYLHYG